MTGRRAIPFEGIIGLYFLAYLPNIIVTKLVTSLSHQGLGRALTGLETLPATLILNALMTYLFIWLSGWHRDAHDLRFRRIRVPLPTRYTFLSGIGTALILFTVPLSFTIKDVSIPFIQLLMRGDILIIAPLVDLIFGRRVRWWSWVALCMVATALIMTIRARGGLNLPPIAIVTVLLYTLGYFVRLAVMTHTAKTGDSQSIRRYFVEEKMVALPLSIFALALISVSGIGGQAGELWFGFVGVWTDNVILPLILIAGMLTVISIFSAIILLDVRENSYCVPMERAASLVAGIAAAYLLAFGWGFPMPNIVEAVGALILIAAIALLSIAPRRHAET